MTSTIIGVVYSVAQSRVRRIIVFDDDKQAQDAAWAMPGEALLTYDAKLGTDIAVAQAHVTSLTGRKPDSDDCAVVDEAGIVLCLVKADPTIDKHPDGSLVGAYAGVSARCTYDAKTELFTAPSFTVPAGVDKRTGQPVAEKVVPAQVIAKPKALP